MTHETTLQQARDAGARIVCAMHGADPIVLKSAAAREAVYASPEGAEYKRQLAKVASHVYATLGDGNTVPGILFEKLANTETWSSGYDVFIDPVRSALGQSVKDSAGMHKKASWLPGLAVSAAKTSDLTKLMLAGGVITGGGLGALTHLAVRNSRQASADNATLEAKLLMYKRLQRDIEEDLELSGALDTDKLDDDREVVEKYEL